MSDKEKEIFDNIILKNNTVSKLNYERQNQAEIDTLVNQFQILKGEILIGNSNPDLLKQLKVCVLKLVDYNVITMKEINKLLQAIFLLF